MTHRQLAVLTSRGVYHHRGNCDHLCVLSDRFIDKPFRGDAIARVDDLIKYDLKQPPILSQRVEIARRRADHDPGLGLWRHFDLPEHFLCDFGANRSGEKLLCEILIVFPVGIHQNFLGRNDDLEGNVYRRVPGAQVLDDLSGPRSIRVEDGLIIGRDRRSRKGRFVDQTHALRVRRPNSLSPLASPDLRISQCSKIESGFIMGTCGDS